MTKQYSKKLFELSKKFSDSKYQALLESASSAYLKKDFKEFDLIESQFPSDQQLLETLIEKLKGKSVYTNLKKILANENVSKIEQGIALSSLYTHSLIESKDNAEYISIAQVVFAKLQNLQVV